MAALCHLFPEMDCQLNLGQRSSISSPISSGFGVISLAWALCRRDLAMAFPSRGPQADES
jgi:hypothetical protein